MVPFNCLSNIFNCHTAWKVSKCGVISGPYFPVFRLNTGIYEVISVFSPNTVKYGQGITPYLDTFHAVSIIVITASKTSCAYTFEKGRCKVAQSPPKFQVKINIQLNAARVSRLSIRFLWLWYISIYSNKVQNMHELILGSVWNWLNMSKVLNMTE